MRHRFYTPIKQRKLISAMWAVVPSKQFGAAKKRLAALLSEAERVALAEVMLRDVLAALHTSGAVEGIVVVSKEPAVQRLAQEYAAHYLPETDSDLSLAVVQGGAFVKERGADTMLMVPGDVPLLCATDIQELVGHHLPGRTLTLVSDREGTGTNGLVVSPIDLIEFSYGINSFSAHRDAGNAANAQVLSIELEGLSLDIDTPEDVRTLMAYDRASATFDYLDEINVVSRLPHRHNVRYSVFA
ncbi:MAG: 2-phospho-L-lactate guanylyltransferase [Gammaproteobacteria bacterium]|jgi:2-phospho-L-lactate guanylyltransferase